MNKDLFDNVVILVHLCCVNLPLIMPECFCLVHHNKTSGNFFSVMNYICAYSARTLVELTSSTKITSGPAYYRSLQKWLRNVTLVFNIGI